jgi:hypothetical protein
MTRNTGLLNDTDLATVTGGGGLITLSSSTITLPHLPQAKDLLTPQQIAKLLSFDFNPPVKGS